MSKTLLAQLVTERRELEDSLTTILETAATEQRDLSDSDQEGAERIKTRMLSIDAQMDVVKSAVERSESGLDVQHLLARGEADRKASVQVVREAMPEMYGGPALGDFVDSPEYRAYGGHGASGRVTIEARATKLRAPLQEGAAPGSLLLPNKQKFMVPTADAMFPLLDAVTRVPVSSNAVDLVVYGDPKGATGAAKVAELAVKPEAAVTASMQTVTIDTLAYWIQFSRQLSQDAPALRSFLSDQMTRGLLNELEKEITSAINGVTFGVGNTATGASKQSLVEVVRLGMAMLQGAGYRPQVMLANPANAAALDLFLLQATTAGAVSNMPVWGLQVVPVPALAADEIYVADMANAVWLLERTGIELFLSDSHVDTFVKNVLTMLAEVRAKAVVVQPNAIVKLEVTP